MLGFVPRTGIAFCFLGLVGSSIAITPDYGPDTEFVGVGSMGASCVAMAPHWVITARHVGGTTVNFGGTNFTAVQRIDHDDADISLLRFNETFSTYYTPYFGDVLGQQVTMVGFGSTGTAGSTGITITGGGGTRRKANNIIDATATVTFDNIDFFESWVVDVDGPTGNGTLGGGAVFQEGGLWGGDSGGGWFVDMNSQHRLVGINSWIDDGTGNGAYNDYGDWAGGVALSNYEGWIFANTGVPEPSSMLVLGLGGLALLRRKRR